MKKRPDEKHGHAKVNSPEYRVWSQMLSRCNNPRASNYAAYGGAGVAVCGRWLSFVAFLADMGPRPAATTLDRIDNARGYEPSNCRWATHQQQAENRSTTHRVTLGGQTKTVTQWAREVGISDTGFLARVRNGEGLPEILRPSRRASRLFGS